MNKILIADDNKQITSILASYARKEGLEPVIALDGAEALDMFARFQDDIVMVLLDVMMPEMDGLTACSKIREFSNVPIILLTAKSETEDKVLGLNVGKQAGKTFVFSGPEEYVQIMTSSSVEAVTLANNHVEDFGIEGYENTKRVLDEAGVAYVEEDKTTIFVTESGLRIGLYADSFYRIP